MVDLRVWSPAYGTVRSLAFFAPLVAVTDRDTEAFVATLAAVAPGADPSRPS